MNVRTAEVPGWPSVAVGRHRGVTMFAVACYGSSSSTNTCL